jgi:hypothetical protein
MPPETRYAKKGETSIAYQVVGDGPVNLVLVNGLVSHMALFGAIQQRARCCVASPRSPG